MEKKPDLTPEISESDKNMEKSKKQTVSDYISLNVAPEKNTATLVRSTTNSLICQTKF